MILRKLVLFSLSAWMISCGTEPTPTYTISTASSPTQAGSVSYSPTGSSQDEGTSITFTATPSEGYLFSQWQGDLSGTTNPASLTLNKNVSVTGVFEKRIYPLTITIEGEGTVKEEVIQAKTDYEHGATVRLTAQPNFEWWVFENWSGDITSSENQIEIQIDRPTSLNANFTFSPLIPALKIDEFIIRELNWNDHRKNGQRPYYLNNDLIPDIVTSGGIDRTNDSENSERPLILEVYDYTGSQIFTFDILDYNPDFRDSLNNLYATWSYLNDDDQIDYALLYMGEWPCPGIDISDPDYWECRRFNGSNIYLLLSKPDGSYDVIEVMDDPESNLFGLTAFDYDFDGYVDVLTEIKDGKMHLLKNVQNEYFEKIEIDRLYISEQVRFFDWDKDGKLDLVNIGPHNKEITIITDKEVIKIPFEDTGWDFYFTVYGTSPEWLVERTAIIDADLDGDWDIIFGGFYDQGGRRYHEQKYFENQEGRYQYQPNYIEHDYSLNAMLQVWVGDLDGDGDEDLYYPTYTNREVENNLNFWWENTGSGFVINRSFRMKY